MNLDRIWFIFVDLRFKNIELCLIVARGQKLYQKNEQFSDSKLSYSLKLDRMNFFRYQNISTICI